MEKRRFGYQFEFPHPFACGGKSRGNVTHLTHPQSRPLTTAESRETNLIGHTGEDRDCRDEHRPREPRLWVHKKCRFLVLVTFFCFAKSFSESRVVPHTNAREPFTRHASLRTLHRSVTHPSIPRTRLARGRDARTLARAGHQSRPVLYIRATPKLSTGRPAWYPRS